MTLIIRGNQSKDPIRRSQVASGGDYSHELYWTLEIHALSFTLLWMWYSTSVRVSVVDD